MRYQVVVLSEEMSGPMTIGLVSMKNYTTSQYYQQHVTIWMGATDLDELTAVFDDNYTPGTKTLVFDQDSVLTGGSADQWFQLELDTPFDYDGQSNLIIDIETSFCSTIYVWGWDTGGNRNLYTYISGSSSGAPDWTIPHLLLDGSLELQTTTFGRIKTLF